MLFLASLMSFFSAIILTAVIHFEKPLVGEGDLLDDVIDENPREDHDDGPYQTFVVASFVTSLVSLVPIMYHLRR